MEVTVRLDATPELLKALNALGLKNGAPENKATVVPENKAAKTAKTKAPEVEIEAAPEEAPAQDEAPAENEVAWGNCVEALKNYRKKHGVEKARALLTKFKAPTVQDLKPEQYANFVEACQ